MTVMNDLTVLSLSKRFSSSQHDAWALNDVSFSLGKGTVTGILGHNGAGKTTLLGSLCGSVKPTSGTICFEGKTIAHPRDLRRLCSYMPQPYAPLRGVTPMEALTCMAGLRGSAHREAMAAAQTFLHAMDIERYSHTSQETLSGGCRRLISLGMALIQESPVLLLDEPTNDVDPLRRERVWSLLRHEADRGRTILVVTHNLNEIGAVADRLLLFDHGRLIQDAPPHRFVSDDEHMHIEVETTKPALVLAEISIRPVSSESHLLKFVCSRRETSVLMKKINDLMDSDPWLTFSVRRGTLHEAYERIISHGG